MLIDELQTESSTVKALRNELKTRQNTLDEQAAQRIKLTEEKNQLLQREREIWEHERNEILQEAEVLK